MQTLLQPPARVQSAHEHLRELKKLDDNALVRASLSGDELAFTVIADRYRNWLISFICKWIGDRDRAEDLVQETFIRLTRHLHRFDPTKKFSTWIFTIAGNLTKNELRNNARRRDHFVNFSTLAKNRTDADRPLEWADDRYQPDRLFEGRELEAKVDAAVSELEVHHRVVFVLRDCQGKSYVDIAEILGVPIGTVKSRLFRARECFAEIIAPTLD